MSDNLNIIPNLIDNSDDEEMLMEIINIKKNILNYIDIEDIINKIISLLDKTKVFSFKNKRNAKYINKNKPLFILQIHHEKAVNKFGEYNDKDLEKYYQYVSDCLHSEIIAPFSDYLMRILKNNDEFKKVLKKFNLDLKESYSEDLGLTAFLTASIFSISVDKSNNIIYLEYII
jgi:hypothetical protein